MCVCVRVCGWVCVYYDTIYYSLTKWKLNLNHLSENIYDHFKIFHYTMEYRKWYNLIIVHVSNTTTKHVIATQDCFQKLISVCI